MKTFEQYTIDEKEKLFLELVHLDELEMKFDFFKYKFELCYVYNKTNLFVQEKPYKDFWISENDICIMFFKKYGLTFQEIHDFMKSMIEKYFKLNNYSIRRNYNTHRHR